MLSVAGLTSIHELPIFRGCLTLLKSRLAVESMVQTRPDMHNET